MAVVATGFFDGVHLGHRLVIRQLVGAAAERGAAPVVVTFWPHPRTVLQDGARDLRLLNTLAEKKALLEDLGVERVEVVPFTREFSRMTTEEYLRDFLIGKLGARTLLLGYDNRMGRDAGTPDQIRDMAERLGLEVIRTDRVDRGAVTVSSTKIRQTLAAGEVAAAADMLGYPYSLHGVVVAGNRLGRTIGFPTANMQLYEPLKLVPGGGVYRVRVETLGGRFDGMCNIGVRPTVGSGNARTVETHIFGFDQEIYGLDIRISFLEKIRDEVRFGSMEALRDQLVLDRDRCLAACRRD